MSTAVYALSGDPLTFGHLDIIKRAAAVFDKLVVAIGVNPDKNYLFSEQERVELAEKAVRGIDNVEVTAFSGLLVDFAYETGANVIVKGVRNPTDFEYENNLFCLGDTQELGIDTFVLLARKELQHVSSSAVKSIQKEQGLIHGYVPLPVKQALEAKLSHQYIVSVTGEIGAGKSYVSQEFVRLGKEQNLEVHNIELDEITHQIYQELPQPKYQQIRDTIAQKFGPEVQNDDGTINRKVLGEIVFQDVQKLAKLNKIMAQPLMVRIRRELYGKKGLIFLNAALIIESNMSFLSNNNVCLIKTDQETQKRRLTQRNLTDEQIERRLASQYNFEQKKTKMQQIMEQDQYGHIWEIENSVNQDGSQIKNVFKQIVDYFKLHAS